MLSRNKNFELFKNSPELFNNRRFHQRLSHIVELVDENSEIKLSEAENNKFCLTIMSKCLCRSSFYLTKEEVRALEEMMETSFRCSNE